MIQNIRNIDSSRENLRSFGFLFSLLLALLAAYLSRGSETIPYLWLAGSLLFLLSGVFLPAVLLPLHKVWMTLSVILGWTVTRTLLFLLYFMLLTPLAITGRLIGKRFLALDFEKDRPSYWTDRSNDQPDAEDARKQY